MLKNALTRAFSTTARRFAVDIPKISSVVSNNESRLFNIQWSDGTSSIYPFIWLRDNAPAEPHYYIGLNSSARNMPMTELDLQSKPVSHKLNDDGTCLDITWPNDFSATYKASWLKKRDISDTRLPAAREDGFHKDTYTTWEADEMRKELEKPADFNRMMSDDVYLAEELSRFIKYGLLRVVGVPKRTGELEKFGNHIGFMWNQAYGVVFTVRIYPDDNPTNAAYTRKPLEMHTDNSFTMNPPDVQILHCIHAAESGGLSQFSDGFRVAEQLQKEKPDVYEILKTVTIEYMDQVGASEVGRARINVGKWPVIRLDHEGKLERIIFANYLRSWFFNCPVEKYEKVYNAIHTFMNYCYAPRNLIEIKIDAGEFMIFANNRVLHGRAAYEVAANSSEERHLEGGYLAYDAVKAFIRHTKKATDPDFPHAAYEVDEK